MMHKPDSQLLSEIELFFGSSGLLDTLASRFGGIIGEDYTSEPKAR